MFKWIKKFIEKLAKENSEAFHGQKLDCCQLNQRENKRPNIKNSRST